MQQGFLYLVAIIDWATRRVLSWRLSNTLTAGFCVEALSEALARFGKPGIFNTDQGAQFTSDEFIQMLRDHGIEISMDGRGRCHDNIFVERLWWTVKHEWVYLRPAANGIEQKRSLAEFFDWYNLRRPHQALGWRTPNEAYLGRSMAAATLAAHKLHSTPQQHGMNLISGNGETSSRLPPFSLFLPESCPNNRDRRITYRRKPAIAIGMFIRSGSPSLG
jgi:Integrase core domain